MQNGSIQINCKRKDKRINIDEYSESFSFEKEEIEYICHCN